MKNYTIYIVGEARTTMDNAITKMFGTFYIGFEVSLISGEIIDVDCNATLRLTKDFLYRIFINKNIEKDEDNLKKEIASRYFGSSEKAVIMAYHDALQKYNRLKKEV